MTTDQHVTRRSGSRRGLPVALLTALAAIGMGTAGCTPDIPQQGVPPFVELQFDPTATPPKSYEPTILTTNAETQLLDFSVAGIIIPEDPLECQTQTALPVAACEFYWYLQQLDGYPTLTPARTPVSAPLDMTTVTVPGNLFIFDLLGAPTPITDVDVRYDADAGYLVADPTAGWDLGGVFFVAVRGYANGIKGESGDEAVKSIIYVLLAQDNSLTCDITSVDDPALDDCAYYGLFTGDARFNTLPPAEMKATIFATLQQLEQMRALYKGELPGGLPVNVWNMVEDTGQMPPNEVGILWAFRTHTNSVIELNPMKGMAPAVTSTTEIRLTPKGPIVADTLRPFSFTDNTGTVFVLDGTAYLSGDFLGALPTFTVAYAEGDIVITMAAPLIDGHQYIMVVSNEVQGKTDAPIVPSPVSVFLRTRGELVDDFENGCPAQPAPTCPPTAPPTETPTATPLVPGLSAAEACQLEDGRRQLTALLDAQTVIDLTKNANRPDGLTRELVAFLYAFQYCAQ